jgi:hypothetical protein
MRRPTGATVVAYIIVFLYLIVPAGTSIIFPTSVSSRTVQAYAEIANPAFALGSTLLDTPIRSPINAPQRGSTNGGGGGTSCTVTPTGSFCTSVGPTAPLVLQSPPAPIPQNDKVQAGAFKGFRAWQAFGTASAVLVAILVGMSVAILSERPVHLPGRRRRREARRTPVRVAGEEPAPEATAPPDVPQPVLSETTAHD